ncbi:MAG: hcaD [Rhodococcus erythropolis]|nr:FAD-dependent oxidoreductase [Rhodococcus erythropolis]MDF2897878.1 hcaD [Rhodococcus erythropolis]
MRKRHTSVVILGAGQAGFQAAASLRERDFEGRIILVGDEPGLPYQRPPLSKAALLTAIGADMSTPFRPAAYFTKHEIDLKYGTAARIDRDRRAVVLESGERLEFDYLILALGARNRILTLPGADLAGVQQLRTLDDAERIRSALKTATHVVTVGAGFIGMEIAAASSKLGKQTSVIDPLDRPMARSLSRPTSNHFTRLHTERGTLLHFGKQCSSFIGRESVEGVELANGESVAADLVVVGVGVEPRTELAEAAGLAVDNGVEVDACLRTSDPVIFAIGDCARFPTGNGGDRVRIESVQNATDQARFVAAHITGAATEYAAVPWFWSQQFDSKLQIAGLSIGSDVELVLGDQTSSAFSVLRFRDSELTCVESVNKPADHITARRILGHPRGLPLDVARQGNFDLKSYAQNTVPA